MWGHFELDSRKLQCFACFSGSCFFENYPFFSETLYYACTGFKPFPHQANCFNVQSSRLDGNWCKFTFSPVFSWFWCFLPAKIIVVFVSFFSLLVTRASSLMFRILSWCMNAFVILLNVNSCELGMSTHVALHCGITIQYICVWKHMQYLFLPSIWTRINPSVVRASISLQVHFQNECYFEWEWERIVGNVVSCLVSIIRNNQIILQALNMWSWNNRDTFGRRFGEENAIWSCIYMYL